MNLAKMGLISPLDLFKDLDLDNPQQRYENWVKWKTDPMSLSRDIERKGQDSRAIAEYVAIMGGAKDVKPYDEADENHLVTHRKQFITAEFLKANPNKQTRLLKIVSAETNSFELRQALDSLSNPEEDQQPTQQPPQQMPPTPGQNMLPPGGGIGTPIAPMGQGGIVPPPLGSPSMGAPISPAVDQLINQVLQSVNPVERMDLSQILNPETQPVVDMTDPTSLNLV